MTLADIEQFILRALAAEGAWPSQPYRRSATILRQALSLAGRLTPDAEQELCNPELQEVDDGRTRLKDVDVFDDALVRLVHGVGSPQRLVDGEGNFGFSYGNPSDPPAHPYFTACRLTPAGEQIMRAHRG
jgi:hypothetical protein